MTVTYTHKTHTAGCIGGLTRLLFIWKGSLFKQIFAELILYFGLYFVLSLIYRYSLVNNPESKLIWELFCMYCEKFSKVIPISFLLGFYVTQVVSRWWAQFMSLPWPDTLARYLAVYVPGTDKKSRDVRRTVCRWVNLGNVLALRLVSYKVMLRFPSYEHLVESGLATNKEILQLKQLDETVQRRHQVSWYPFMWAQNILRAARRDGLISNDWFTHVLIKEIDSMANMNGMLICYGWISIPLVYTQVVTLAVYSYFIACMFGRQYLLPDQYKVEGDRYVMVGEFPRLANWTSTLVPGSVNIVGYDMYIADFMIPCFTVLEYLFYIGWLKVAETLLNPFGEDDDDFDTYYLIDRNVQVAFLMADEAGRQIELEPDPFNNEFPIELKHTVVSAQYKDDLRPHMPTDDVVLQHEQVQISDSVNNSKANLNLGSRLNLAGSILSTPITIAKYGKNKFKRRNTIPSSSSPEREREHYGGRLPPPTFRVHSRTVHGMHGPRNSSVTVNHVGEKRNDLRLPSRQIRTNSVTQPANVPESILEESTEECKTTGGQKSKIEIPKEPSAEPEEGRDKQPSQTPKPEERKKSLDENKQGFEGNAAVCGGEIDGDLFDGDW